MGDDSTMRDGVKQNPPSHPLLLEMRNLYLRFDDDYNDDGIYEMENMNIQQHTKSTWGQDWLARFLLLISWTLLASRTLIIGIDGLGYL